MTLLIKMTLNLPALYFEHKVQKRDKCGSSGVRARKCYTHPTNTWRQTLLLLDWTHVAKTVPQNSRAAEAKWIAISRTNCCQGKCFDWMRNKAAVST